MNNPEGKKISGPFSIQESYNLEDFDCGIAPLNLFLKKYALQNHKNNSSRTYVALQDGERVIGYFSLAYGSVEHASVPPRVSKGLGRYPVPVLVLTRLAVHASYQNLGLGRSLLKHALFKALNASEIAGLRAVVVNAKDETAKKFYERFGFCPSPIDPLHLFILIKDIQKSIS